MPPSQSELDASLVLRDWVQFGDHAICIPKMKSGREFDLPLSEHMVGVVQRALETSEVLVSKRD